MQSLGRIDEDPQIGADGNVFIKYTNGEKCLEDAKRNISSIIQFRCQRGEEKVRNLGFCQKSTEN